MDADWDEISRVAFPALSATPAGPNNLNAPPRHASAVAFDTGVELLWVGSSHGRVVSYHGRQLQRYTAWRFQPREEGPVRQFLFNDKGIIVLGTRSILHCNRRGPELWYSRNEDTMKNLQCMSFTSKGTSEILVAGAQDIMLVVDVNKGGVVKQVPTERHYTIMKKSRAFICAATQTGTVDFLDPITFKIVKSWQAHTSFINDMDTQSDFVVTCGGSLKQQASQTHMLDPYVNVFDLKNMASMKPVPFPPLAAHVRLHPRMLTTSIVVSQTGQMHVVDLLNPNTNNVRIASLTSLLNLFEVAPSGEALVMADMDCSIHLWGSPSKIRFTDLGSAPDLPGPVAPIPNMDWSLDTSLSTIGLPYYAQQLFSVWPADLISDVGAPPAQLTQAFLATLKKTEYGLYGPNTLGTRRNQYIDTRATLRGSDSLQAPKFLSEKARESAMSPALSSSALAMINQGGASSLGNPGIESLKAEAPPVYRNVEIKYSKFGVDDFDFGYFNQTRYAGLENHITNSYANSLLQLMHYTPLLRNLALQHAATGCLVESCLLCELGYVFDMLQKAEGSTCHATNMLKALSHNAEASRLKLIEDENKGRPLTEMVQGLCRFLFIRSVDEYKSIQPASTRLEQSLFALGQSPPNLGELVSRVMSISVKQFTKCMYCRNVESKQDQSHFTELLYPSPNRPAPRGGKAPRTTFSQVLKMSVEREMVQKGWCKSCQRYLNVQMRRTIDSTVPAVLALGAAVNTPDIRRLWATPGWLPEEIGIIVDQNQFFCYEGQDLRLHLQRGIHNITVYSLVGMVVSIEGIPPQKHHLAAMINVAYSETEEPTESKWHLFNDFSVHSISTTEALTFNTAWKTPSVIMYHLKAANNKSNDEWKDNLDTSVLFGDLSPCDGEKTYQMLDPLTERPTPGTIVALDTEFVSLRQAEIQVDADGGKEVIRPMWHALARVSVVRGHGEHEGLPFIDDYISIREPIVDYLTTYSGIHAGDLDPRTSPHSLVPLKVVYKKLWVLLNLGCKFLGHGLKQDFRVINMQIPRAQVIDTIDLFILKSRLRKIGLAFLAWQILKEDIQLTTHDSIEDARTALKLYRKYLEYDDAGILEPILEETYRVGKQRGFKPPRKDGCLVQRTATPPIPTSGVDLIGEMAATEDLGFGNSSGIGASHEEGSFYWNIEKGKALFKS